MSRSLMPGAPGTTPNAWCTWATQNLTVSAAAGEPAGPVRFDGDQGARSGRDNLHEGVVFGPGGWIEDWPAIRGDLHFLLDDGWDVPFGTHPGGDGLAAFGSLELAEDRFPSCGGTPAERLARLNDRLRAAGWRGAGLWVAAQRQGEHHGQRAPVAAQRDYWRERIDWSRAAGLDYWKVDWGVHADDLEFRARLTEWGHEGCPGLVIEHSHPGSGPLNGLRLQPDGEFCGDGRFTDRGPEFERWLTELLRFSDLTRIYDTLSPLTTVTSVGRAAWYLQQGRAVAAPGLINVEDEVYLAAGLGCALAAMRSPRWTMVNADAVAQRARRSNELVRAVRWQRLAPAFAPAETDLRVSEQWLTDSWTFAPHSTWWSAVFERTIAQAAPAAIARGLDLPGVAADEHGEVPFVVAARYPNGAVSVATRPRLAPGRGLYTPLAAVTIDSDCAAGPVGVFGRLASLTLGLSRPAAHLRVWAQDPAADEALDVTSEVVVGDGRLTVPGTLMDRIGGPRSADDVSEPAMVLRVETAS